MATTTPKKKTATKKAAKPKAPKVDPAATKYVTAIGKEFRSTLDSVNIPLFSRIAKDSFILPNYFGRHAMYERLMGELNTTLFDRYFRSTVSRVIAKEVYDRLHDKVNMIVPGLWDQQSIWSLVVARLGVKHCPKGYLLSAQITPGTELTQEEVDGYTEGTYMYFSDYTEMNLFRFCLLVQNNTMATIMSEVTSAIPAANMCSGDITLPILYGQKLVELLAPSINNMKYPEGADIDAQADAFVDATSNAILVLASAVLIDSGLNQEVVEDMLKNCEAKVYYSKEPRPGKTLTEFIHSWNRVRYAVIEKGTSISSIFEFCPQDIVTASQENSINNKLKNEQRLAVSRLGKAYYSFCEMLIDQIINREIRLSSANNPVDIPKVFNPAVVQINENTGEMEPKADAEE